MTTAAEHMAATLLRLAGAERDAGNESRAEIFEAAADLTGATCSACGAPLIGGVADAEVPGPPADGREKVIGETEREHDRLAAPHKPFSVVDCWCLGIDITTERHWATTPAQQIRDDEEDRNRQKRREHQRRLATKTDGGGPASPPSESPPPS